MIKLNLIGLGQYTPKEIKKFDEMHQVLEAYNAKLGTSEQCAPPPYTNQEMAEYSGYRQMIIARDCAD